ncbi:MAG: arylsulfatase [Phycisphaerae bacterium]|nr:arylsulfatase [Phycisphaerae bacterium]
MLLLELCIVALLLKTDNAVKTTTPPNIVFILADDLGYGEVGCFGQEKIKTPHIDALAKEGVRLTEHYSGSPVCASSRCVLLTGLHTGHAEIRNNREVGGWGPDEPEGQLALSEGANTIGSSLQKNGYATGAFGKWGLGGPESVGQPNKQGFDTFYGYLCQRVAHNYYPTHLWNNETKEILEGNESWFAAHEKLDAPPATYDRFAAKTYAPDLILEEAVDFIDDHAKEPFFLYFASTIPHLALQIPDEELAAYPDSWDTEPYLGDKGYLPHPRPRAAYAAMITRFDAEVGAIVKALKKNNIADNTIIVVTSDNGPSWVGGVDMDFFGSRGGLHGRKAQLWEGGIRVPTVVWWPEHIQPNSVNQTPSAFWDWYPTLLAVADQEIKETDGINLLPNLTDQSEIPERGLYWEFGKSQAYRLGNWKLLQFNTKEGVDTHLYQLDKDESESVNVADTFPEQVALMKKLSIEARTQSSNFQSFLDKYHTE